MIRELRNSIFSLRPHEAASLGLARGLAELAREYEVNALVRPELLLAPGFDERVPAHVIAGRAAGGARGRSPTSHATRERARCGSQRPSTTARCTSSSATTAAASTRRTTPAAKVWATCANRLLALGGSLHVASATGEGTTITLEWPAVTRIMLVDDHEVVRAGLRALLEAQDDLEVVGEAGTAGESRAPRPLLPSPTSW